jgi:hypothetical protein
MLNFHGLLGWIAFRSPAPVLRIESTSAAVKALEHLLSVRLRVNWRSPGRHMFTSLVCSVLNKIQLLPSNEAGASISCSKRYAVGKLGEN